MTRKEFYGSGFTGLDPVRRRTWRNLGLGVVQSWRLCTVLGIGICVEFGYVVGYLINAELMYVYSLIDLL